MLIAHGCTTDEATGAVAHRCHAELWDIHRRFAALALPTDEQVYSAFKTMAVKEIALVTFLQDPWEAAYIGEHVPVENLPFVPNFISRVATARPELFGRATTVVPARYASLKIDPEAMFTDNPAVFTTSGAWDIRPNPGCYDVEAFPKNPERAKADPRGFGLQAWWTPIAIRRESMYFAGKRPAKCHMCNDEHQIISFRDFDVSHISELLLLKHEILAHLRDVYKLLWMQLQSVLLCFHAFAGCVPAHLHITFHVQTPVYAQMHSIPLDDVIMHLVKFGHTKLLRQYPQRILRPPKRILHMPEDAEHAKQWMAKNSTCEGTVPPGYDNQRQALCKLALLDGAAWKAVGLYYPKKSRR
jgi:hypothetical protein